MGLISFLENAGEKLLASSHAAPTTAPAQAGPAAPNVAELNAAAGAAIAKYIASQNLSAQNLKVSYDGASKTVTVSGIAPDQATKEKIVLCCGNVHSVAKVDDQLTVAQASSPPASMYEVKSGDTLSKIAKSVYGDANDYQKIFEANKPMLKDPDKIKDAQKMLQQSFKYRTEHYGYVEGYGTPSMNKNAPKFYAKTTNFMGLNVMVNEKIIPALKCVEAALKSNGAASEYAPKTSSGIRFKNTYRGVEVSNHMYGIALDIEPDRNKCCGCVKPWSDDPVCTKTQDVWKRMVMPKSWVDTFEKYGFYWLGHDVLQDTMHFEFLGDPDKIVETP